MTSTINKCFLLFIFLLFAATTQCMEVEKQCMEVETTVGTISNTTTIQELQTKRDSLKYTILNNNFKGYGVPEEPTEQIFTLSQMNYASYKEPLFLCYLYHHDCKTASIRPHNDRFTLDCLKKDNILLQRLQKARMPWISMYHLDAASALGVITIAPNLSLTEKKDIIQQLVFLDFKQTTIRDKELAIVEQWERWQPIIQKICLLRSAKQCNPNFLPQILPELVKHIEIFMLKTEKALF